MVTSVVLLILYSDTEEWCCCVGLFHMELDMHVHYYSMH